MTKTVVENTYEFRGIEYPMAAKTTALLIIDMQNDYFWESLHPGEPRPDGVPIRAAKGRDSDLMKASAANIIKLAQAMRGLAVPVIHCIVVFEPDHADDGTPPRARKEWHHLTKGSWGAQIIDEFAAQKGDYIIEAKCHSKFPYTPLELILRNKGIKTLVFTGGNASVCVESTIRDAVTKGFRCVMTSDGTLSTTRQLQEDTLKRLGNSVTAVLSCEEVQKLLKDN